MGGREREREERERKGRKEGEANYYKQLALYCSYDFSVNTNVHQNKHLKQTKTSSCKIVRIPFGGLNASDHPMYEGIGPRV